MKQSSFPAGDHYIEPTAFGTWIRSPAVRETIESVLIAVLLALLFRYFEAEAYVIPTGSMAPDLQGQHIDVACPECDFNYRSGSSADLPDVPRVACPNCMYPQTMLKNTRRDHRPFSGDRILVNKFAYDFDEPDRWDVIVFKYPNNGKQNFIKRLIGLPNEGILIEHGDIYAYDLRTETFADRKICRKPPLKQKSMLQMVYDTKHISKTLLAVGWPSRWQQWKDGDSENAWRVSDDHDQFSLNNSTEQTQWLKYRHLQPTKKEWDDRLALRTPELPERMRGKIPAGELISDHYAYNDVPDKGTFLNNGGLHWVGDLAIEANVEIKSDSGTLVIELVEGPDRFQCQIDVSTGQAVFVENGTQASNVTLEGETKHETSIKGTGDHQILFANADNKLFLWVDDNFVGGCEYTRSGDLLPTWSLEDAGDAEPIGIGGRNIQMQISRLQVQRDIYYTSKNMTVEMGKSYAKFPFSEYLARINVADIKDMMRQPRSWTTEKVKNFFKLRDRDESYVFPLDENQLLPMGDNSPQSSDARIWEGARYLDKSYLLGEAMFIYWPHAKTSPLPFWPNFERMKFIR